ncbi:MAG: enoyl-CoA hydratase [Robiginitomaculum sp.]|nr:MAG: enoyl-CoA hydratase [Robiginitomaculum sp.]
MTDTISFQLDANGPIARLTLCRPKKRNAMNRHFWAEFPKAIRALSDAGKTRVLVIDAQGPIFCAGLDISMFGEMGSSTSGPTAREGFRHVLHTMQSGFVALDNARFPVIAALQGPCIGGGVDLISACDLRYGTPNAEIRIEEINVGMMADLGTLQRLPKLIAPGLVRELAFTGNTMSAEQGKACGLLNAVLPDEEALQAHVNQIAEAIAAKPPVAIAATKDSLNHARDHGTDETLRYMRALQAGLFAPEDIINAIAARMEGRTADFDALPPLSPESHS